MRPFLLMTLLVGLSPANAFAQDPFGDVTNEPRPSEFIQWDDDAFREFKGTLESQLREGPGIFGTPFAVLNALPEASHRRHTVQIIHRSGYTQPEIHETKWDIYVILDGSGTALLGGQRVNWVEGLANEDQRPELAGAQSFSFSTGDILHVPARSWHQVRVADGASVTYALINVFED